VRWFFWRGERARFRGEAERDASGGRRRRRATERDARVQAKGGKGIVGFPKVVSEWWWCVWAGASGRKGESK
jgi:hypothetical protein